MCSVNEIEDSLKVGEEKAQSAASLSVCMKCGEKSMLLVRARDPMCKLCFINYFTHKFRATLGKSKAIRQGEKVLIAFSGGTSSCSLLNLIKEGLSESAHKKLRFKPEVVFINESLVLGWTDDKRNVILNDVIQFSQMLGFDINIIDIEKIFIGHSEGSITNKKDRSCCKGEQQISECDEDNACLKQPIIDIAREKLKRYFQNINSLTAKQDALNSLRVRLLRDYAKEKQCSKIIVAETSTRLSIKLLLNIAQGRGGALPYDIGVSDNRDEEVGIIRPMRELTSKEVAFYNRIQDIEPIVNESLDTMATSNASLQKQTEAFVTSLQASFPSTVSTIFRTGDKLTVSDDLISTDMRCVMCQTPVVERVLRTADRNASREVPSSENNEISGNQNCCGKGDGSCQNSSKRSFESIRSTDILENLCYGCRLTFRDMGENLEDLPPYVIEELERSIRRSQMRDSIEQYLLD